MSKISKVPKADSVFSPNAPGLELKRNPGAPGGPGNRIWERENTTKKIPALFDQTPRCSDIIKSRLICYMCK